MNPFSPDRPLLDPNLFSGREDLLRRALGYLLNFRTLFVSGARGIGKTSFAGQLKEALRGNPDSETRFSLIEKASYPYVVSYRCSGSEDTAGLLTAIEEVLIDEFGRPERASGGRTETRTLDLKVFKSESKVTYEPSRIDSLARHLTKLIRDATTEQPLLADRGLVVFIDEVDLILPTVNLGTLLKILTDNLSDLGINNFCFALIGIDSAYQDLLSQHASTARYLTEIPLPPMTKAELADIIHRAIKGTEVRFSPDVIQMMYRVALGYPHPIHVIGYELFEDAKNHSNFIGIYAFERAVSRIVHAVRAKEFEELHSRVPDRASELILIQIARAESEFMSIEAIADRSGKSPDTCAELCQKMERLGFLEQKGAGYYRIQNPAFQVYLKLLSLENDLLDAKNKAKLRSGFVNDASQFLSQAVSEEECEKRQARHEQIEDLMWKHLLTLQLERVSQIQAK